MTLERPIPLSLFWGDSIDHVISSLTHGRPAANATIVLEHMLSYDELVDEICGQLGVDRHNFKLKLLLVFEGNGNLRTMTFTNDKSLCSLFQLARTITNFWANIHVEMEEIPRSSRQSIVSVPTECMSMVALLNNFAGSSTGVGHSTGYAGINSGAGLRSVPEAHMFMYPEIPTQASTSCPRLEFSTHDSAIQFPLPSDDELDDESRIDDSFDDHESPDDNDSPNDHDYDVHREHSQLPPYSSRVMEFMNDIGKESDDRDVDGADDDDVDFWSESENEIRLGMRFDSKPKLHKAVTLWSISQNREFKVVESRKNTWVAKCKGGTSEIDSNAPMNYRPTCLWGVRAVHKKTHKKWQITRWVTMHNCLGTISGNNNRNLTSTMIAFHIFHQIKVNPDYPVKNIQADIKQSLHVDVSYKKAFYGRKKAIELVYGNWESNFTELPSYKEQSDSDLEEDNDLPLALRRQRRTLKHVGCGTHGRLGREH